MRIMDLTMGKLVVNKEKLLAAFTPDIFATDLALDLVGKGVPFRDAYRQVGESLDSAAGADPAEAIARKKSTGSTGNLRLDIPRAQAAELASGLARVRSALQGPAGLGAPAAACLQAFSPFPSRPSRTSFWASS